MGARKKKRPEASFYFTSIVIKRFLPTRNVPERSILDSGSVMDSPPTYETAFPSIKRRNSLFDATSFSLISMSTSFSPFATEAFGASSGMAPSLKVEKKRSLAAVAFSAPRTAAVIVSARRILKSRGLAPPDVSPFSYSLSPPSERR